MGIYSQDAHQQAGQSPEHGFEDRTICGTMKSTPIAVMEKTAGVEPLESLRKAKILAHGKKMKLLPDHPLYNKLQELTQNRLKQKSLNHLVKKQQREHADVLAANTTFCEKLSHNS